ncbi:hypothetical protein CC86DRAFT_377606 [Ophiobolus disseminans]|uniref:Uncharacterized protein n=1 Tax=Ophiobolus disseminans TaxID=1469910 RepID=A0A6A7AGP1_9PLEO|nr:hypothetical protein CC86DRAFT_377606 [Ophiobolus disseminans]
MGLWNGNLLNTPLDIAIDTILTLCIALSYILQIFRIIARQSTHGISPYYILLHTLFSNLQVANALLLCARAWPTDRSPVLERINIGDLSGSAAFGAILGLVQIGVQWFFSIVVVTTYAANSPSRTMLSATTFTHFVIFTLPAILIALPTPSAPTLERDIFTGFSAIVNTWVSSLFVILQFYPQYLELQRSHGDPGVLSLLALCMQGVVFVLLGVRWLQRLGASTWGGQSAPLSMWFQWGWLPFNYFVGALGEVALLVLYSRARRPRGSLQAGEETPLMM